MQLDRDGLDSMFDPFNVSVQYGSNSKADIVYDYTVPDKPIELKIAKSIHE
jgi:hypothetical protein